MSKGFRQILAKNFRITLSFRRLTGYFAAMKPSETLFAVLSVLWIFPSIGSLMMIYRSPWRWPRGQGLAVVLESVPVEIWIALILLALQAVFTWRGRLYWRRIR